MTSNDIKAFALTHRLTNKTSQTKFGFESSFVYKEGCFAKIQLLLKIPQARYKSKRGSARFTNKKLSFSKRSIVMPQGAAPLFLNTPAMTPCLTVGRAARYRSTGNCRSLLLVHRRRVFSTIAILLMLQLLEYYWSPVGRKPYLQGVRIANTTNPVTKAGARSCWLPFLGRQHGPSHCWVDFVLLPWSHCIGTMSGAAPGRLVVSNNWSRADAPFPRHTAFWYHVSGLPGG